MRKSGRPAKPSSRRSARATTTWSTASRPAALKPPKRSGCTAKPWRRAWPRPAKPWREISANEATTSSIASTAAGRRLSETVFVHGDDLASRLGEASDRLHETIVVRGQTLEDVLAASNERLTSALSAKTEDARAVLDAAGAIWSEHFDARHAQLRGFIDESAGALSGQIEEFDAAGGRSDREPGRGLAGPPSRGYASVAVPMERRGCASRRKILLHRERSRRLDRRRRRQRARHAGLDDRDVRRNARRARRRAGRRLDRPDQQFGRATEFAREPGGRRRRQRRRTDRRPRHAPGRELRRPCRRHRCDHVQSSGRTRRPPDRPPRALPTSLGRSPGGIRERGRRSWRRRRPRADVPRPRRRRIHARRIEDPRGDHGPTERGNGLAPRRSKASRWRRGSTADCR